jgi:hypothetical protein
MSIGSAAQASAHEVHISAQNIACRAAVARGSFASPTTSGWSETIFWIDIVLSYGPPRPPTAPKI